MTHKDEEDYPTVSQVIGRNVKALREEHEWRQEDLAERARRWGLDWNRTTVAAVETGIRAVDNGELTLLAVTLVTSLVDLLAGEGRVRLTKTATTDLDTLRALWSGESAGPMLPRQFDVPQTRELSRAVPGLLKQLRATTAEIQRLWPKMPAKQWDKAVEESMNDEAVKKAARKLGTRPHYVAIAARRRWGRGLAEERDARVADLVSDDATPRTRQALRGHVTRGLMSELEPLFNRKG